jgi:hypothetical protein
MPASMILFARSLSMRPFATSSNFLRQPPAITVALRCQVHTQNNFATLSLRCTICTMADDDLISKVMSEMGRRGGHARAKKLTAKQRKESALKASKAAAKARSKKAAERKKKAQP